MNDFENYLNLITKINLPLLIFLLVIIFYIIGAIFIIYHLARFGIGKAPKNLIIFFLIGSVILLILNFAFFSSIDWGELVKKQVIFQ